MGGGGADFDLVAVAQLGIDRNMAAIDIGTSGRVTDIGVDRIGEVERCGTARQSNEAALGRKAVDLILEEFEFGVLEEFFWIVALEQGFHQFLEPHIGPGILFGYDCLLRHVLEARSIASIDACDSTITPR